jgi:hypothetical protein
LRSQIEALPATALEGTEAVRHALQDQMRAIEELSNFTAREAARRDVAPPAGPISGGPLTPIPSGPQSVRNLNTLTSTLANELNSRQRPPSTLPVPTPGMPVSDGRDNWSLGDLLARASRDEEAARHAPPALRAAAPSEITIDVDTIARALDSATASAIWSRFRAGQRGIMVRSIYTNEGRAAFDEVNRRYRAEPSFQRMVNDYLDDFERSLRDTEQRDSSGRMLAHQLVSDMGRVYLFLAHASGRLS